MLAVKRWEGEDFYATLSTSERMLEEDDIKWLEWRFEHMQEFFESSWTYQQMARKMVQQGIEQGVRQSIEAVVQTRFPTLLELTRERLEKIHSQEELQRVLVAMSAASMEREAQHYLLALKEDK